jgi:hypothetical protein
MGRTYLIVGFGSEREVQEFCTLLEFARYGRVVCDWRDPDRCEREQHGEDGYCEPVPVYDDTDRSEHPRFPLARALNWADCYDQFPVDEPPALRVHTVGAQDGLLLGTAAADSKLTVHRLD